ncbi:hypothetical protein GH714_003454 [Hevea brasiliensis]|uniref:NOSIC domain-containing protein n=1 Tax=Hevea brasiliensis TaxID=3981 RepID=A0A6A6M745_HEVBR|nr:hypothetical protein GH714_003454 [Hevea brasiliensis]
MNFGVDRRMIEDKDSDGELMAASKKKLCYFHRRYNMTHTRGGDENKLGFLHYSTDVLSFAVKCRRQGIRTIAIRLRQVSWPELVGANGDSAVATTEKENKNVEAILIREVDIVIIQAIGLLDDLDKELNTYAMRVREWYGWHFPDLAEIIQDNILYAKAVKLMGSSDNAIKLDFSKVEFDFNQGFV